MDPVIVVAAAGLEQQDAAIRVFGKAVGQNATGATRSDDDIVERVHGLITLLSMPGPAVSQCLRPV
ncbi:hypothetical protein D3C71_2222320 [compost metagenome]